MSMNFGSGDHVAHVDLNAIIDGVKQNGVISGLAVSAHSRIQTGTDGATTASSAVFTSSSATFQTNGVQAGDHLTITSGSDTGTYEIQSVDSETQVTLTTALTTTATGISYTTANSVDVASGSCLVDGTYYSEASAVNVGLPPADSTQYRIDIITYDTSAGEPSYVQGTLASGEIGTSTGPEPPDIPSGDIILARVYVPAGDNTIDSNDITDERVIVQDVIVNPSRSEPSRSLDTTYQNTTDRPIMVTISVDLVVDDTGGDFAVGTTKADLKSGASSPPATIICSVQNDAKIQPYTDDARLGIRACLVGVIPRNYYYEVETSITGTYNDAGSVSIAEWHEYQL
ncbi:hypothetical protein B6U67_03770 [Methanosarcinales archaeon ex4484_138]|nr:MAG: hypothetical protein B6U67_03770 [Methanosarcinales archaeon ex4484_138]